MNSFWSNTNYLNQNQKKKTKNDVTMKNCTSNSYYSNNNYPVESAEFN